MGDLGFPSPASEVKLGANHKVWDCIMVWCCSGQPQWSCAILLLLGMSWGPCNSTLNIPWLLTAAGTWATSKQSVKAAASSLTLSSSGRLGCSGVHRGNCLCRSKVSAFSHYCRLLDSVRTRVVCKGYRSKARHIIKSYQVWTDAVWKHWSDKIHSIQNTRGNQRLCYQG